MSPCGPLLRALPPPSSTARQDLERNLLALLQAQGVSPEDAVRRARDRLPRIEALICPPPPVVSKISPPLWPQLGQLHRQAATGVGELRQGLRQPAPRPVAPALKPPAPARPAPKPAPKPSWRRSGWLWFCLLGVVLPLGWMGGALWSTYRSQAIVQQAPSRLEQLRSDTAAQQNRAAQVESRLQTLQSQAQGNLIAQRDQLESEVVRLRDTLNRWGTNAGLPTLGALPAGFAVPSGASDAYGNAVVRRGSRDTDPASGLPLELVHPASGLVLVLVPAGQFQMGSPANESGRYADEGPVHEVRFAQPFYLSKYEVTQDQWQKVMGDNPSHFKGEGRRPVEHVSWQDAQRLVGKLNESLQGTAGWRFGLPSEAQWEYACRAGSTGRYAFGDDESRLGEYAWFDGNSGRTTHPVGQKKPNAWGLYDLHGNVWEWCEDVWHDNYEGAPSDGRAWTEGGDQNARVLRGGSWFNHPRYVRAAYRGRNLPDSRSHNRGVRVVLGVGARTP